MQPLFNAIAMKLRILPAVALLLTLNASTPTAVFSQPASNNQYQPGFWQPEGKVNPNSEIKVQLFNQTGYILEYGKAEGYPNSLSPGETRDVYIKISSRKGDIATIPINAPSGTVPLRYEYRVVNNVVIVRIVPTRADDPRQDRAVYIDETGRVYSF
ncbi:MAG TPA: hypothetical protein VK211_28995 [Kamptonema sp.]|nr:hypothetical protein [Kamptonema sp.]